MAADFQFGLVIRGQAEPGEDIARRFEETLALVRLADRLGYDSITKTAHYSAHPWQMLQLVPMLARFTAEAPHLRLNAGVVLLPLLSPLHVAEEFATLDVMSGGKIILGVGLGYRDVEFKAFGVPRAERARRLSQNLVAIRRLWTEDTVTMTAGHFELDGASCSLKPIQTPHPPIWVGAFADRAVERAARLGDCWYIGPSTGLATLDRQMILYRRALEAAGSRFRPNCRCGAKCLSPIPARRRCGCASPTSAPNTLLITPGARSFPTMMGGWARISIRWLAIAS
jgi:alkanesulfonate monooxygenase SsuD/methylene tetrahydromethanopterin reductase-like flavin-dependent oxidoreductase (luciferase family)